MKNTPTLNFGNGIDWSKEEIKISGKKTNKDDERIWKMTCGSKKEGYAGSAVLRLLQDLNGKFYITRYNHFLKDDKNGKFWVNISPRSFGKPCPASELFGMISSASDDKYAKEIIPMSEKHYVNVKIVKDPGNPLNDNKIFVFKFGNPIKRKFLNAMNPPQAERDIGTKPKNLFHPIDGNNIQYISGINSSGWQDYDARIADSSAIYPSLEEAIKDIEANTHDLDTVLPESECKSYDELAETLSDFMEGITHSGVPNLAQIVEEWRAKTLKAKVSKTSQTPQSESENPQTSQTSKAPQTPQSESETSQTQKKLSDEEEFRKMMEE